MQAKIAKLVEFAQAGNLKAYDATLQMLSKEQRQRLGEMADADILWFIYNAQPGGTDAEKAALLAQLEQISEPDNGEDPERFDGMS